VVIPTGDARVPCQVRMSSSRAPRSVRCTIAAAVRSFERPRSTARTC